MKKQIVLLIHCFLLVAFCSAQHTVIMKNGQKLSGTVKSMNNGVLELSANQTINKVNVSEISSIVFAEEGQTAGAPAAPEPGEKQITAGAYLIRYKVADRTIARAPVVDNRTQKKGTVVVSISIDKYGHVMKATAGAPGSTTTDDYLFQKGVQAAQSTIFNNEPTAPLEQTGYMIIAF